MQQEEEAATSVEDLDKDDCLVQELLSSKLSRPCSASQREAASPKEAACVAGFAPGARSDVFL